MSNINDFIIEDGVLKKYVGTGGEVVIPDGVTVIGFEAFYSVSGVTDVKIPNSTSKIGDYAFYCCHDIVHIDIPDSVEHIGCYAFNTCTNLSITFYGQADVGEKAFDGVSCIFAPNLSFGCFDTTSSKRAAVIFGYLENMREYKNEQIVEEYQKYIVSQRKKLISIILKKDIVEIIALFAAKKKITIANFEEEFLNPAIEAKAKDCVAFLLDWKVKNISVDAIEKSIERELEKDPYNVTDMKKLWAYEKTKDGIILTAYKGKETMIAIPPEIGGVAVSALGDNVFGPKTKTGTAKTASCLKVLKSITKIIIPNGIKSIGNSAFERCEKLECIEIPNSVTTIGWRAFCDCHSLKYIELPGSITELKAKTFQRCKDLETIILPKGLLKIGNDAFDGCEKLKSITLPNSLTTMGMQVFFDCRSLAEVSLSSSLNGIGVGTFTACSELERMEFPESIKQIGKNAFQLCKKLSIVKLSAKTKNIDNQAFNRCENLEIHAPAGSYAETYAKENNIPFVAE